MSDNYTYGLFLARNATAVYFAVERYGTVSLRANINSSWSMNVVRNRVVFTGRVQGVGFRHATKMQARSYDVCGYVRNLEDGTVELVIEGECEEVASFIVSVQERMAGVIKETETVIDVASGEFAEFTVQY